MKKRHHRIAFFYFLLVNFILSQSVIGMELQSTNLGDDGVRAIEYKRRTDTGKDKVIVVVTLDGDEKIAYPINNTPYVRYAEHRKSLLDLICEEDISYIYLAPHPSKLDSLVFFQLSYLKELNERERMYRHCTINFLHWYYYWLKEEDDSMCILLMPKDCYSSLHMTFRRLEFEEKREIPILTGGTVTSSQLREFLLSCKP